MLRGFLVSVQTLQGFNKMIKRNRLEEEGKRRETDKEKKTESRGEKENDKYRNECERKSKY